MQWLGDDPRGAIGAIKLKLLAFAIFLVAYPIFARDHRPGLTAEGEQ